MFCVRSDWTAILTKHHSFLRAPISTQKSSKKIKLQNISFLIRNSHSHICQDAIDDNSREANKPINLFPSRARCLPYMYKIKFNLAPLAKIYAISEELVRHDWREMTGTSGHRSTVKFPRILRRIREFGYFIRAIKPQRFLPSGTDFMMFPVL